MPPQELAHNRVVNKSQLKKSQWYRVRLRPVPLSGDGGTVWQEADDDWLIQSVDDSGVTLKNTRTYYQPTLGYDQIREFMTDPARDMDGNKHGFLHLKVQLSLTDQGVRVEPTWK